MHTLIFCSSFIAARIYYQQILVTILVTMHILVIAALSVTEQEASEVSSEGAWMQHGLASQEPCCGGS